MHHCLNKEELKIVIEYKNGKIGLIDDEQLRIWLEGAESWQDEVCCLNYIFSQIIDREHQRGTNCNELIELLYKLGEEMFFTIQEIDYKYISELLRNVRRIELTLEEELILLQNKIGEHQYEHVIRY
jgi:hypothetical protein